MKRHSALIPLSREHHDTLILAQVIKKGAPDYRGMPTTSEGKKEAIVNHFNSHLRFHFRKEEDELFEKIRGKDSDIEELIIQLANEHREIESIVGLLAENKSLEENLNKLGLLLENHIRKEERQLFELIPQLIDETTLEAIKL